jgi:LmbE family N-acetylglucosaminyl deacetylase
VDADILAMSGCRRIEELIMSKQVMARMSRSAGVPPSWTSVLAVIAHPDEASFGLGAILDAFVFAGARVEVLCLTHGQAWALQGAPGDLAALRGAELASAADVLGPTRSEMLDCPDGALGEHCQARLVAEVVAAADCCFPDGLLVFDTAAGTGHLDHVTATSAGLRAAQTLNLPVLGWSLSETVAARLRREFGAGLTGHGDEDVDLRVTLDRARQRLASHSLKSRALPGGARWRRLELLADTGSLRWLRPPGGVLGHAATRARRSPRVGAADL